MSAQVLILREELPPGRPICAYPSTLHPSPLPTVSYSFNYFCLSPSPNYLLRLTHLNYFFMSYSFTLHPCQPSLTHLICFMSTFHPSLLLVSYLLYSSIYVNPSLITLTHLLSLTRVYFSVCLNPSPVILTCCVLLILIVFCLIPSLIALTCCVLLIFFSFLS